MNPMKNQGPSICRENREIVHKLKTAHMRYLIEVDNERCALQKCLLFHECHVAVETTVFRIYVFVIVLLVTIMLRSVWRLCRGNRCLVSGPSSGNVGKKD